MCMRLWLGRLGGPWGDQWYNWGSPVAVNLVLERLAGTPLWIPEIKGAYI